MWSSGALQKLLKREVNEHRSTRTHARTSTRTYTHAAGFLIQQLLKFSWKDQFYSIGYGRVMAVNLLFKILLIIQPPKTAHWSPGWRREPPLQPPQWAEDMVSQPLCFYFILFIYCSCKYQMHVKETVISHKKATCWGNCVWEVIVSISRNAAAGLSNMLVSGCPLAADWPFLQCLRSSWHVSALDWTPPLTSAVITTTKERQLNALIGNTNRQWYPLASSREHPREHCVSWVHNRNYFLQRWKAD